MGWGLAPRSCPRLAAHSMSYREPSNDGIIQEIQPSLGLCVSLSIRFCSLCSPQAPPPTPLLLSLLRASNPPKTSPNFTQRIKLCFEVASAKTRRQQQIKEHPKEPPEQPPLGDQHKPRAPQPSPLGQEHCKPPEGVKQSRKTHPEHGTEVIV